MTSANIIADSLGPNGARLTTFQLRFPRFILAQFNTHRAISKNARSSRAVPIEKLILEVETDPVVPTEWGKNRRGMQATEVLGEGDSWRSQQAWLDARDAAVKAAHQLLAIGLHKQVANRLLEPFMWADVVATATDWANFFALRCHDDAQPEMRELATMMAVALRASEPVKRPGQHSIGLPADAWHLPYVTDPEREGRGLTTLRAISVARCARVSYVAFDGKPASTQDDLIRHSTLRDDGHWSPFEHQGKCQEGKSLQRSGNFNGWDQYRQSVPKSVHASFDFSVLDAPKRRGYVVEGRVAS